MLHANWGVVKEPEGGCAHPRGMRSRLIVSMVALGCVCAVSMAACAHNCPQYVSLSPARGVSVNLSGLPATARTGYAKFCVNERCVGERLTLQDSVMWVGFTAGGPETVTVSLVVTGSDSGSVVFSTSAMVPAKRSPGINDCPNTSYFYVPDLVLKSGHLYPYQGPGA